MYLRSLKQIVEGISADLGFENLQYLRLEHREVNGERVFGPANGAIGWQLPFSHDNPANGGRGSNVL